MGSSRGASSVPDGIVRIGTSGWSYPKGHGTWNGVFYPLGSSAGGRRFDELTYYAERFDTVEVNSTFYRIPAPTVAASWVRRTPPGFEFAVKLFQKFTHPSMFAKTHGEGDLAVGVEDVDAFRVAIDPLQRAGKLGPVLAQFPASFRAEPEAWEYLRWLLSSFRDYSMAIELRHSSWSDHRNDTASLLNEFSAAWVQIDEPKFRFSISQDFEPNVSSFFYARLHGRNADAWWQHEASEDRYNYFYSAEELEPFAQAATAARRVVRKLYLYMNNHFEAKSVANAIMLKAQLGLEVAGRYSPALVDRFPELRGLIKTEPPPAAAGNLLGDPGRR
jgi:uncharacterized protein YecE (DUF72 family)